MPERECEFTYVVIIPNYGNPRKLLYPIGRRLANFLKLKFGEKIQVHIGTREGNLVRWTEEVWPKGE